MAEAATAIQRDSLMEAALLGQASADDHDFIIRVIGRLDTWQAAHGDNSSWEEKSIGELVDEISEEVADVPGWAMGIVYRMDQLKDPGYEPDRGKIRARVLRVLFAAYFLHQAVEDLREAT